MEKVMRFPQGREKALTFSYDDGVQADKRLLATFRRYGFRGTFNLNSDRFDHPEQHGRMDEAETERVFRDCGQEIALHGARHIFLSKVPKAEGICEILENRLYLERKFRRVVRGMAYAYGDYGASAEESRRTGDMQPAYRYGRFDDTIVSYLKSLGVTYARTTLSTHSFALPEDWLLLHPTCHHRDEQLFSLAERFSAHRPSEDKKHKEPWMFCIWGHAYEFDDADNWEILDRLGALLAGREDIWYATIGEICDYTEAYRRLVWSADGTICFNPNAVPVWLETRIESRLYCVRPNETVCLAGE